MALELTQLRPGGTRVYRMGELIPGRKAKPVPPEPEPLTLIAEPEPPPEPTFRRTRRPR